MRGGDGRRDGGSCSEARRFDAHGGVLLRGRIFARLREGHAYDEIAREEQGTPERVSARSRGEALAWRFVDDETDHAKLQVARLAQAMQIASVAVADGDVKAIPALLKVIDRVDRYQRTSKVNQVMTKRRASGSWTRSTALPPIWATTMWARRSRGRLGARIRGKRLGKRTRKKKCAGVAASL